MALDLKPYVFLGQKGVLLCRYGVYALTSACQGVLDAMEVSGVPAPWAPDEKGVCGRDITQAYLDADTSAASLKLG